STTLLTALFALGGLTGFGAASKAIGDGMDPYVATRIGAFIGLPAFALVITAAPLLNPWLFVVGNFLIGFGGALFGHGTLTSTMNRAPREQAGLALGAWGAVQATAAGIGVALSGIIRDVVNAVEASSIAGATNSASASGYMTVYSIEIALLIITLILIAPLLRKGSAEQSAATESVV
ncbi:MAG: PucC family protein, partial [Congregibacter sp.]|nr:PucC family protein [Congregibacter sp.]